MRRLFEDPTAIERDHHRRTGIFPIMHVVALRRPVLEAHPWVAMNLLQAFEAAKQRSLLRMADVTASPVPLPWVASYADQARAMFGEDFWPYGVEPNRRTLEAFLLYAWQQGVAHRHLAPEELFPASCLAPVKA